MREEIEGKGLLYMARPVLEINGLGCEVEGKQILKDLDLTIKGGEIHVIMGPNGTGKSTLASTLMGHPRYVVTGGEVTLNGEDVLGMEVDERARAGLFLGMQYPSEIPGVTNADFLRAAMNSTLGEGKQIGVFPFRKALSEAVSKLEMNPGLPDRYLNEGFSGGEKKRNEILQMMLLKPAIAMLDEIDSGLDIDALRIVGNNVTELTKERGEDMGVLLITHYQRILQYVKPDHVHILMNGRIVKTGDYSLAEKLEADGYEWLRDELGIEIISDEEHTALGDASDLPGGLPF